MNKQKKIYQKIDALPSGRASDILTDGTLILEGGGWKGLYTLGVLDCMMQHDINLTSVAGVSAGALSAIGYVSGQIGWGARIDLTYRHDKNYCGTGALKRDKGITGFSYLFDEINRAMPVDETRLYDPSRQLAVTATNLLTGKGTYFEKGSCDLFRAVQASATVPFVSRPVMIDGVPYLDGGCAEKIPLTWDKATNARKTVVIRTRELSYRRDEKPSKLAKVMYRKYPHFVESFNAVNAKFNRDVEQLERDATEGKLFLIAPSKPVTVTRFDGDMDKLGDLYWLGYHDMTARLDELKAYLKQRDVAFTAPLDSKV